MGPCRALQRCLELSSQPFLAVAVRRLQVVLRAAWHALQRTGQGPRIPKSVARQPTIESTNQSSKTNQPSNQPSDQAGPTRVFTQFQREFSRSPPCAQVLERRRRWRLLHGDQLLIATNSMMPTASKPWYLLPLT